MSSTPIGKRGEPEYIEKPGDLKRGRKDAETPREAKVEAAFKIAQQLKAEDRALRRDHRVTRKRAEPESDAQEPGKMQKNKMGQSVPAEMREEKDASFIEVVEDVPSKKVALGLDTFFATRELQYPSQFNVGSLDEIEVMADLLDKVSPQEAFSALREVAEMLINAKIGLNRFNTVLGLAERVQAINDKIVSRYLTLLTGETSYSVRVTSLESALKKLLESNVSLADTAKEGVNQFLQNIEARREELLQQFDALDNSDMKIDFLLKHEGLFEAAQSRGKSTYSILLDASSAKFGKLLKNRTSREILDKNIKVFLRDFTQNYLGTKRDGSIFYSRIQNLSKLLEVSGCDDDHNCSLLRFCIFKLSTEELEELQKLKLRGLVGGTVDEALALRHTKQPAAFHLNVLRDMTKKMKTGEIRSGQELGNYLKGLGPLHLKEVYEYILKNHIYNSKDLDMYHFISAIYTDGEYVSGGLITPDGIKKIVEGLVSKGKCAEGLISIHGPDTFAQALDEFRQKEGKSMHLIFSHYGMQRSHVTPIHISRDGNGNFLFIITDSTGADGFDMLSGKGYNIAVRDEIQKWCKENNIQGQVYALKAKRQRDSSNCPVFTIRDCVMASRHLDALVKHVQNTATLMESGYYEFENPLPCFMIGTQSLTQLERYRQEHAEDQLAIERLDRTVKKHTHEGQNLYAEDRYNKYAMLIMMDLLTMAINEGSGDVLVGIRT